MKYAIIEANGRQYKAEEGKTIIINARLGKKDESVMFDKVLLLVDGENTQVGTPYVNGLFIKGKILESGRGKKLVIQKFKAKVRYRRKMGFRPEKTVVVIEKIGQTQIKKLTKEKVTRKKTVKHPKKTS